MEEPEGVLKIPCGEDQHWRSIRFWMRWAEKLDLSPVKDLARVLEDGRLVLLLADENDECKSFALAQPSDGESGYDRIQVHTLRSTVGPGDETTITHDVFFRALKESLGSSNAQIDVLANVDLEFSGKETDWRLDLLANPPKFRELDSDLGTVALTGLTLGFHESAIQLHSASLRVHPDSAAQQLGLAFQVDTQTGELDSLYEDVIRQAESFTALFLERPSLEDEGDEQ